MVMVDDLLCDITHNLSKPAVASIFLKSLQLVGYTIFYFNYLNIFFSLYLWQFYDRLQILYGEFNVSFPPMYCFNSIYYPIFSHVTFKAFSFIPKSIRFVLS